MIVIETWVDGSIIDIFLVLMDEILMDW